ncbi:hypothetical protein ACHAPG_010766 [Botrytis cinerea]
MDFMDSDIWHSNTEQLPSSNAFMDAFAHYTHNLSLPATSLSLGQVLGIGIVSYMPEYQQATTRNGFYGNDEHEFLRYCDVGIGPASQTTAYRFEPLAQGHLLLELNLQGYKKSVNIIPSMPWLDHLIHVFATWSKLRMHPTQDFEASSLLSVDLDEANSETPVDKYGIDSVVAAEILKLAFHGAWPRCFPLNDAWNDDNSDNAGWQK